ncbi:MAG: winged helix-turn-helix domain-containing protein, partial [Tistlia sp.]
DRIRGLEIGADDYIAKPFSGRELVVRIKAVLRRTNAFPPGLAGTAPRVYRFGAWTLDSGRRELESDADIVVPLSTGEYKLLLVFLQHPQRVLTREQLLDLAKGRTATVFDRSIDLQVSRLRRKLGDDAKDPKLIKTVWGGGYLFTPKVTGG